ncbi:protein phosphatase 1J isoform X2 [Pseudophryne corroboree]|uniref:protein phosphatase 1J isoform X2 n=1 Tax=Pseudophryne corroboree TaxID=495146 RepID=UPI003081B1AE
MINKVKAAVSGLVGSLSNKHSALPGPVAPPEKEPPRAVTAKPQPPCRPGFLKLSPEEFQKSGDHNGRTVLSPKTPGELQWGTGYAEVINAGKSQHNEDQACCEFVVVEERDNKWNNNCSELRTEESFNSDLQRSNKDEQIEGERTSQNIEGGCCALAAVCLMGKLFVANAGDSRAIIIRQGKTISMSQEFTPETERQRLQFLATLKPELLGNEFTCLEFPRRIQQKELGKRMLYRDHTMTGWSYKAIEEENMKFPLIYGEGKKARVMATIGVTRGFGDHDLKVYNSNIYIKPFLSCVPGVKVYDLAGCEHGADDVMVMGTDGLWDVITDREVADIVQRVFASHGTDHPNRYNLAAQELVLRTRGVRKESGWRLVNGKMASLDDISVFVIPLIGYGS